MSDLLPCPRCGCKKVKFVSEMSQVTYEVKHRIECDECLWSPGSKITGAQSIAAWNNGTIRAGIVKQSLTTETKTDGEKT